MTDKEKIIKELKEALDSLDITNKYRLNLIRAIEYLQKEPVSKQKLSNSFNIGKDCKEELVSEEFEEALAREWKAYNDSCAATVDALEDNTQELAFAKGFYSGSMWKEQQFEKSRLAACDRQTEKDAEIERDFVTNIIEKEHRQPTFDDAIKYGMRLHKEQMAANTADAMIGLPYENKDGGYTHLVDVSRPLPVGNNKIAIIFKED